MRMLLISLRNDIMAYAGSAVRGTDQNRDGVALAVMLVKRNYRVLLYRRNMRTGAPTRLLGDWSCDALQRYEVRTQFRTILYKTLATVVKDRSR